MSPSAIATVATDAGLLALWRGSAFADVDGYEAWEERVNERLAEVIERGDLVPVGIQGDGAFGVRVAIAPGDHATQRETTYTVVTSDPYAFVADGGPVFVSGIESVGDELTSPVRLTLPPGRYAVRVSLIAWDEEPGARGPDGSPGPDALADFLILIDEPDGTERFRTSEVTFDPPS